MHSYLNVFSVPLLALTLFHGDAPARLRETQESKKDISTISQDALRAVVLIIVSDIGGKEIKQGSGVVVSADGKIITNFHVIEGGNSAVIKFPNGAFFLVDGVLATDKEKDIAVLKAAGSDFPVVPLGDSDKVQVGEEVVTIGSPLALEATVSNGIISSIRELKEENLHIFQTTAPISHGSSGGALLNMRGEVIGITTAQLTGGQNLNFAIPINVAKSLLTGGSLRKLGEITSRSEKQSAIVSDGSVIWTSLTTGRDFKIRIDGDHLYVERIRPPAFQQFVQQGAFSRCDLARQGAKWAGTCSSYMPYEWVSQWSGTHVNWCRSQGKEEIILLTPTRIEGETETSKEFDAAKCIVKKSEMRHFAWIPKN
jgi:hypothetical protein